MNFFEKLNTAIAKNQSLLVAGLDPNPEMLPNRYLLKEEISQIDALWDWLQSIIVETQDVVCAYKPTFGFYQALGTPGLELLKKTLRAIPDHLPVILDAKHSDLNSSSAFAQKVFADWQVDAMPGTDRG